MLTTYERLRAISSLSTQHKKIYFGVTKHYRNTYNSAKEEK
jgi:hypothetical protein